MTQKEMRQMAEMVAEILSGGTTVPEKEKTVRKAKKSSGEQQKVWRANEKKTQAMAKKLEDAGFEVNRDAKTT